MYLKIIQSAAAKIGASVDAISEKPATGRIRLPDGRNSIFCDSDLGLNSGALSELVQNKHVCGEMLRHLGFNSPETYFIKLAADVAENDNHVPEINWDDVYAFADKVTYPLFLKPTMGTEGADIYRIEHPEQIENAIHQMKNVPSIILQKTCRGKSEYRVVVLNGKIELAYERKPFTITGDGESSIETLIRNAIQQYQDEGRSITLRADDHKIDFKLAVDGLSRYAVLDKGVSLSPLANVNLSEGATCIERTDLIAGHFSDLCHSLYKEMGLTYYGLDLMADWESPTPDYDIIEINRKPGYTNFANSSKDNFKLVQGVFDKALEALAARQTSPVPQFRLQEIQPA